jgi:hypothetical protein
MRCARGVLSGLCTLSIVLALVSCEREQRQFRITPQPPKEPVPLG